MDSEKEQWLDHLEHTLNQHKAFDPKKLDELRALLHKIAADMDAADVEERRIHGPFWSNYLKFSLVYLPIVALSLLLWSITGQPMPWQGVVGFVVLNMGVLAAAMWCHMRWPF